MRPRWVAPILGEYHTLLEIGPPVHGYFNKRGNHLTSARMDHRTIKTDHAAHTARFQYIGYDPRSDTAIVQYLGSKSATQLTVDDLQRTGAAGAFLHAHACVSRKVTFPVLAL